MKQYEDKGRTERELKVGDQVYLKLKPYRQVTVSQKGHWLLPSTTGLLRCWNVSGQ
jgi:hypothetical protein